MSIESAILDLPGGAYAVGVSGGADSVALLLGLCRWRKGDVRPHVVHLDHETRKGESRRDAEFVAGLAGRLGLACTVARRSEVEKGLGRLPNNRSALYRRLRYQLFGRVVAERGLAGVVLAHHADDQAETIWQRLLRGSEASKLGGMSVQSAMTMAGRELRVFRPLLGVRRANLRSWLMEQKEAWRDDASNQSAEYLRNRLRAWLEARPELEPALAGLGDSSRRLGQWVQGAAPVLPDPFAAGALASLPGVLATESARRFLRSAGCPAELVETSVVRRLMAMAGDAATPPRQHFPGKVLLVRRRGWIGSGGGS